MNQKHLKFESIPDALEKLKNTMAMQSELNQQEEIEPLLARIEAFEIRKDDKKVHPLDFSKRHGLWIKSNSSEKFYYGTDLVDLFLELLSSKPPEIIVEVYSKIEWVNVTVSKHPGTGVAGLLIETEMENFECVQCGRCCLDLSDAYQTSIPDSDVSRWDRENRYDILEWVSAGLNDVWINPVTGEPVSRCPWLRKLPEKEKYICRIHETKPEHCRNFPKSKRHALENGCKGFNDNSSGFG